MARAFLTALATVAALYGLWAATVTLHLYLTGAV